MAKVKIQGNASGTGILTVTAPNTSTDRTITLPDATGTLATTGDITTYPITTTDSNNIGVGSGAVDGITTGDDNVGVGTSSLGSVTTGINNTAIGVNSLYTNTTGGYNVGLGRQALYSNTTASNNTAVGYNSLLSNSTGANIVAVGYKALQANTTASENTAVGREALFTNTTGADNVAVGSAALYSGTTHHSNTAIGRSAMINTTTGNRNVAVGMGALDANTNGSYNVAVGKDALGASTSADANIGIGYDAGSDITTGGNNVLVGTEAGHYNVAITTGTNNVCIGAYTRPSAADGSNQVILGYDVQGSSANQVHIGSNAGKIYNSFASNATWTQTSDERLKKNIQTNTLGLDFINDLRPVTYNWKKSTELDSTDPHMVNHYDAETNHKDDTTTFHGFIAQEVKAALDTAGVDNHGAWDLQNDGVQGVSLEAMVTPLVKAVQELSAKVKALEEA